MADLVEQADGEPRISHHRLAELIGEGTLAKNVKACIERLAEKSPRFQSLGALLPTQQRKETVRKDGQRGVTVEDHLWLNEKQAAFVTLSYESAAALELRFAMVEVFDAWRKGKLPAVPAP